MFGHGIGGGDGGSDGDDDETEGDGEGGSKGMRHYCARANGVMMHFVHETSRRPDALPLLFLHGWPGSFWEAHKIISDLCDPPDPTLPALPVVPSLPGFGFSDVPLERGFGVAEMVKTVYQLMLALGYDRYGKSDFRLVCFPSLPPREPVFRTLMMFSLRLLSLHFRILSSPPPPLGTVVHGGDWGSVIGRELGLVYPDHCRAIHITLYIALPTLSFR